MANDKSNSGVDLEGIAKVLAQILTAREVDDYRTQLAAFAGNGIAKDQVKTIMAKAGFTTEAKVVPAATINAVRYVLGLGAKGWKDTEDAAKAAFEAAKTSEAPISGNWTVVANAIAKRVIDDGLKFDDAKAAAIKAAKTKARGEIAKAKFKAAVTAMRKVEKDFLATIEDEKARAKVQGFIGGLERAAA